MSDDEVDAAAAEAGRPLPGELGAALVSAREQAGLGIDEVAARTRIRASLIRSMEAGDFAPCGGAVYARGHLRSIAHVVGADDKVWVATYDRMAGQPSPAAAQLVQPTSDRPTPVPFATLARSTRPPVPHTVRVTGQDLPRARVTPAGPGVPAAPTAPTAAGRPAPAAGRPAPAASPARAVPPAPVVPCPPAGPTAAAPQSPPRAAGPSIVLPGQRSGRDRPGQPWVLGAITVVALVIVVSLVALVRPHHSDPAHVAAVPRPPATAPTPSTPAPTPTAPQTLADAGVNVVVQITADPSWVHVVDASGSLVFQGILAPGITRTFHSAQQLTFIFGYAPAIHLTVNGHAIGSPPANGGSDVADAVFDAQSGA